MSEGLAAPHQGLPDGLRSGLERQFGVDLGPVAVHRGPAAAASAADLGATAYTVGRHIVLGEPAGETVLRHEVAHAVQQDLAEVGSAPPTALTPVDGPLEAEASRAERGGPARQASPPVVARQTAQVVPPYTDSWITRWNRFSAQRWGATVAQLTPLARDLADTIDTAGIEPVVAHGLELANWLAANGLQSEADRVLAEVRSTWLISYATAGANRTLPSLGAILGSVISSDVDGVVAGGEALARAGDHPRAMERLATAYELYQYQLLQAGPEREQQLQTPGGRGIADFTRSTTLYPGAAHAYDQMRHILGVYFDLAQEARAAGDQATAAADEMRAADLETSIRGNVLGQGQSVTAEVQNVTDVHGHDALRIFGTNDVNADVTQLPGLPPPREVGAPGTAGGPLAAGGGAMTTQWATPQAIEQSLSGQVALVAELRKEPAVQRAFGGGPLDLNDTSTRLRVWAAVYGAAEQSQAGSGLVHLMEVIGRYLRAFTVHTSYNVDDFGRSYLEDHENTMPKDLAGRLERDCGVYALTIAYEVFRTARGATPRPDLSFELVAMPEHVTLAIVDRAHARFFLTNNDQVIGPNPLGGTTILAAVAQAYAPIRGLHSVVGPAVEVGLGGTDQSEPDFRAGAWRHYEDSASWGIHVPKPTPDQTPEEAREAAYRAFYDDQRQVDAGGDQLDAALDALVVALGRAAGPTDQLAVLTGALGPLRTDGYALANVFDRLGPNVFRPKTPVIDATSRAAQQRLSGDLRFIFTSRRPGSPHPLARLAMALDLFSSLGGTLTADDTVLLRWCDRVPAFQAAVADYLARGRPPRF